MSNLDDELFRYHDARLNELDNLGQKVNSRTLIDLITKAKNSTERSLEKLIQIQKVTVDYLKETDTKNKIKIEKYKEQLILIEKNKEELIALNISIELKNTLFDFYKTILSEIEERLNMNANVNTMTFDTFLLCSREFSRVLLQLIFKPSSSEFQYEIIIDFLNDIVTNYIPLLGKIKMLSNLSVPFKKQQSAKSGDKILNYLEQYIDVIEKWETLGNSYINIIKE